MPTKIRVSTATCSGCGYEIYSRTRHDYRLCFCGQTAVDGGFDYLKISWFPNVEKPTVRTRYLKTTRDELYHDWNLRRDKFGIFQKKGAK